MMPGFFQPAEEDTGIRPFETFPIPFPQSTLSAVVSTDELASAVFLHSLMATALKAGRAYYVGPGKAVSPSLLRKLGADTSRLLAGNVYSGDELLEALGYVEENSIVLVPRFPLLQGITPDTILGLRRIADERSLAILLHHDAVIFNELDIPGEFSRLFRLPEIFDALLVLRTSSYRGHYRMNVTVLRAPPESVSALGEHSILITELVKLITG
jgi:hypothetical protein